MPVYVTRAHITIGDRSHKKIRGPIQPKHIFECSDLRRTPYCFRMLLVTVAGFMILGGGVVSTIIGYKPATLLPWYETRNKTDDNVKELSTVHNLHGEQGPLRILIYIGPILMGLGAVSMMAAIVLFCEIKDRYFNIVLPKTLPQNRRKEVLYDKILEEFRKNYFRGIEVPLQPPVRKRNKSWFSISLSGSGSIASFGRRLSHDFYKCIRRSTQISHTEKTTSAKHKHSPLKRILETDTWMKTSSLPNIRHRDNVSGEVMDVRCTPEQGIAKSLGLTLDRRLPGQGSNGVDNKAYTNSPPDNRSSPSLTKHSSLEAQGRRLVTTVIIHHEINNETGNEKTVIIPDFHCTDRVSNGTESLDQHTEVNNIVDVNRDSFKNIVPKYNESLKSIISPCDINNFACVINMKNSATDDSSFSTNTGNLETVCLCETDTNCLERALSLDSGASSSSLSWDNISSEFKDTRRNTEPIVIYKAPLKVQPACLAFKNMRSDKIHNCSHSGSSENDNSGFSSNQTAHKNQYCIQNEECVQHKVSHPSTEPASQYAK